MACNCKNTVTSFLGGDVANPTTFLNCGEADGTYNNPLSTGKTQCIAEDNVLRILDTYKISGTVKNSGQIVFERTVTGATGSATGTDEWVNDGTYFIPLDASDGKLSATTLNTSGNIDIGNGNGTVSANTFTAPSISIGKESGVITATTVAARYSAATITNSTDKTIEMTVGGFRPGILIELNMGAGTGDVNVTLPAVDTWHSGKYTFIFPAIPNASSNFILNSDDTGALQGMAYCLNGQEHILTQTTVTFSAGKTFAGTRIEVISTTSDTIMIHIWTPADKGHVAYS